MARWHSHSEGGQAEKPSFSSGPFLGLLPALRSPLGQGLPCPAHLQTPREPGRHTGMNPSATDPDRDEGESLVLRPALLPCTKATEGRGGKGRQERGHPSLPLAPAESPASHDSGGQLPQATSSSASQCPAVPALESLGLTEATAASGLSFSNFCKRVVFSLSFIEIYRHTTLY